MSSPRRTTEKGARSRRAAFGGPARLALTALAAWTAALGSLAACLPRGHVELPAQPHVSGEPGLATAWGRAEPARHGGGGNRLGDTPEPADDDSRTDAQLASATQGLPHLNDVARRVLYNGAYFEIHVEVNGSRGIERGIVPVVWDMLRAHTPLSDGAYFARVYTSRGWASGYQVPYAGPTVIVPEAFTPELTPVIFDHFVPAFVSWNRSFNGWSQGMADAWRKAAVIHVTRAWTPELVGGVAAASARAAQITGRAALGAAAVPGAAAAARACAGGRCPSAAARGAPRRLPSVSQTTAKALQRAASREGLTLTRHAIERLAGREAHVSLRAVRAAVERGRRFVDPKNQSIVHVLEGGMASGRSLLVATNPHTGHVLTVITGRQLIRPRFVPLP